MNIMKKVKCSKCSFGDEFEPDEFGLSYYKAIGKCPECGAETVYETDVPTQVTIEIKSIV